MLTTKRLGTTGAALTAGLLLLCPAAMAQKTHKTPAQRLAVLEVAIASGNPVAAGAFLKDGPVLTLAEKDYAKAALLKSKAEALLDLRDVLRMDWNEDSANKLSSALEIRIDADKPLTKLGIGPAPEKLLPWMTRYMPTAPADTKKAVKKAIRQWGVVFGTITSTQNMSWGQATMMSGNGLTLTKAEWEGWTIRERNAVLGEMMAKDPMLTIYSDEALATGKGDMNVYTAVSSVKASGALTPEQLAQLTGKPLADQLYLLGSFFDGSNIAVSDDLKMKINAARSSLPKEVLNSQQRDLLGSMLNTAVTTELKGTRAGDKVLAFYAKNGPMKIAVKPCDGAYSRYDPATRTIVLDSETIQQYMHMKGYTAESVMKNKAQLAEIAKYMSPMVVYESAHQAQDVWAKKSGVYKPHMQEDEIEAMSLEGLYTSEKLTKDAAFKTILTSSRDFSTYAFKKMEVATEYKTSGAKKFGATVRQRYFSGLPSLDAAASQVLGAVSDELVRREGLTQEERDDIDATGLSISEAMKMSPGEISGSVGEIQAAALVKIQKDLISLGVYKKHYTAAARENRKLKTSSTGNSAVPPIL